MSADCQGYLKECHDCGRLIYMHLDTDKVWRPYASWVAGDAAEGEFRLHECSGQH